MKSKVTEVIVKHGDDPLHGFIIQDQSGEHLKPEDVLDEQNAVFKKTTSTSEERPSLIEKRLAAYQNTFSELQKLRDKRIKEKQAAAEAAISNRDSSESNIEVLKRSRIN